MKPAMNQLNVIRPSYAICLSVLAAASVLLAGCSVTHNKNGNGDNVRMSTPFGSMHIKTDNDANVAGIGLSTYPGAVPVKEGDNQKNDNADINLNFGDFHLGVKAASFQSSDSPDKVEAFYRKDLTRYGQILKCEHDHAVGQPTRTTEGLTCDENHKHEIHVSADDGKNQLELRAGSPDHMHIVGIEPRDGGTRIGLVALDLPSHHDDSDSE